jgi:hypothetical protein
MGKNRTTNNQDMKTGIELIAEERREQVEKHNRSIENDVFLNSGFEKPLTKAASMLSVEHLTSNIIYFGCPENWSPSIWEKMCKKPYKERLVISGALLAAEIDRIQYIEAQENVGVVTRIVVRNTPENNREIIDLTRDKKRRALMDKNAEDIQQLYLQDYGFLNEWDIVTILGDGAVEVEPFQD